jgi:hypothetical protein
VPENYQDCTSVVLGFLSNGQFFQVQRVGTFACSQSTGLRRIDSTGHTTCGAARLQGRMGGVGGFFPLRSRSKRQGPTPTTLRPCLTASRKKFSILPTVPVRSIQNNAGTLIRVALLALFGFMGMAFGSVRNVGAHMAMSSGGCEFPKLCDFIAMISHVSFFRIRRSTLSTNFADYLCAADGWRE